MSIRRRAVALAAACTVAAGTAVAIALPGSQAQAAPVRVSDKHINAVLAISIDGLNPDAIRRLGPAKAPNLHWLMRHGASTLNARTAYGSTETLPNHTGMLTGRRLDKDHGGHGVNFNDDKAKTTVHRAAGHYVASIFDVAHNRGMQTALYTSKDKFALYNRTWSSKHGKADPIGRNQGRDKIDYFVYRENETRLMTRLRRDLSNGPANFTFLHLSATDKIGHKYGYMGKRYLAAVRAEDARIGKLIRLIVRNPWLHAHLAVILTSDHGGVGKHHSAFTRKVNYRVPFMVWAAGVKRGANLYTMNPDYKSPGAGRPSMAPKRQPIRNAAVANLAADLLDLPSVPGSEANAKQNLDVMRRQ